MDTNRGVKWINRNGVEKDLDEVLDNIYTALGIEEPDGTEAILVYNATAGTNKINLSSTGHKILVNGKLLTNASVASPTFTVDGNQRVVIHISGNPVFNVNNDSTSKAKYVSYTQSLAQTETGNFYGCTNLLKYVFNETCTTITASAFRGCTNLEIDEIPKAPISVGTYAFFETSKFNCPLDLSNLTVINDHFLYKCTSFNSPVTLKTGVTIDSHFMCGCTAYNKPIDVSGALSIGDYFLAECSAFNSSITLPDSCTIGNYFLYKCTAYNKVIDFKNISTVGTYALSECLAFNQPLDISRWASIPNAILYGSDNFTSKVKIPQIAQPYAIADSTYMFRTKTADCPMVNVGFEIDCEDIWIAAVVAARVSGANKYSGIYSPKPRLAGAPNNTKTLIKSLFGKYQAVVKENYTLSPGYYEIELAGGGGGGGNGDYYTSSSSIGGDFVSGSAGGKSVFQIKVTATKTCVIAPGGGGRKGIKSSQSSAGGQGAGGGGSTFTIDEHTVSAGGGMGGVGIYSNYSSSWGGNGGGAGGGACRSAIAGLYAGAGGGYAGGTPSNPDGKPAGAGGALSNTDYSEGAGVGGNVNPNGIGGHNNTSSVSSSNSFYRVAGSGLYSVVGQSDYGRGGGGASGGQGYTSSLEAQDGANGWVKIYKLS